MWQYNKTENLYPKRSDELIHSDVYLGLDYSDGIKHWKYVKKEKKPNGKWRYYYEVKDPFNNEITTREFEKTEDYGGNYGEYKSVDNSKNKPEVSVSYKKTSKLIGGSSSTRYGGSKGPLVMSVNEGRLKTDIIPAVKKTFNTIGSNISKAVKNGQDFILKLFGRK